MKKDTLLILGLIAVGVYWYMKKSKTAVQSVIKSPTEPLTPLSPDYYSTTAQVIESGTPSDQVNVKFAINGFKKLGKIPNTI